MLINRITFLWLAVVIVFLPLLTKADEYLLVMSKDDHVCQRAGSIYNKDLKEYGKLSLENHEEYNWLNWDENIDIRDASGHSGVIGTPIIKLAVFDINNDGVYETVIFSRSSLGSLLRDKLDIYPVSVSKNRKNLNWATLNEIKYSGIYGGMDYQLKDAPAQRETKLANGDILKFYIDIGHFMYIRPMKFGETYYVSLFGSEGQGRSNVELENTNMVSISKFDKDNELTDVCYLVKAYAIRKEK